MKAAENLDRWVESMQILCGTDDNPTAERRAGYAETRQEFLNAFFREAFAAGRASAGADGFRLTDFRPVWTRSDGSDRPVNELRCGCGQLVQRPGDASLLDLVILAARHECGGRS